MAATTSSGVVMLIVILLATKLLTPSEQGLFFAFMSLGVLVQIGDFGLSYAVMQKASHFHQASLAALHGFETRIRRAGFYVAALSTAAVGVLGIFSFNNWGTSPQLAGIDWEVPWALALLGLFAGQCANPVISLMEGSGKVIPAWRLRMVQEWAGGIACAAALVFGWGLYGIAFYWLGRSLISLPLLFRRIHQDCTTLLSSTPQIFRWRDEMWPFQWRIGLSNLSGFLIFRASIIVILSEQGPVIAGQYGFALAAMNMMLAVTTSWPNSQAARLGQLIAAKTPWIAKIESQQTMKRSLLFAFLSAIAVWSLFSFAVRADLDISRRMTDLVTLALVLATGVAHHAVACQAVLLRAQIKEPLLIISVIGGVANIAGTIVAARFGTPPLIALSALTCALIGLCVSTYLFVNQCKKWTEKTCESLNI